VEPANNLSTQPNHQNIKCSAPVPWVQDEGEKKTKKERRFGWFSVFLGASLDNRWALHVVVAGVLVLRCLRPEHFCMYLAFKPPSSLMVSMEVCGRGSKGIVTYVLPARVALRQAYTTRTMGKAVRGRYAGGSCWLLIPERWRRRAWSFSSEKIQGFLVQGPSRGSASQPRTGQGVITRVKQDLSGADRRSLRDNLPWIIHCGRKQRAR